MPESESSIQTPSNPPDPDSYTVQIHDPKHPDSNKSGTRNATYPIASFNPQDRHHSEAIKHAKSIAQAITSSPHSTPNEIALAQCILALCRNAHSPNL